MRLASVLETLTVGLVQYFLCAEGTGEGQTVSAGLKSLSLAAHNNSLRLLELAYSHLAFENVPLSGVITYPYRH